VSYVDSKIVSQIIGNEPLHWNTNDVRVFYTCIKQLYKRVSILISIIKKEDQKDINNVILMLEVSLKSEHLTKIGEDKIGDSSLDELFNKIEFMINYGENIQAEEITYDSLLNAYLQIIHIFKKFIINYLSISSIEQDFINTLFKLFANSSGALLGNFILFLGQKNEYTKELKDLNNLLSEGV
jgi:hypothetical protein